MSHSDELVHKPRTDLAIGSRSRNGDGYVDVELSSLGAGNQGERTRRLAATLMHDFNNFLTPALMVLADLKEKNLGDQLQRRLLRAIGSVNRARALARDLVDLPEYILPKFVPVDIADVIQSVAEVIASIAGPETRITLDVATDMTLVIGDTKLLERALLNLAFNSHEAMPAGGRLILVAEKDPAVLLDGIASVRIAVSDEGMGMDEETVRHAARPGFTSKPQGTGLGLPMVRGVIEQHGGYMSIISVKGIGTTVTLWLPVAQH